MRVMMRDFGSGLDLIILNDAWLVRKGIEGATQRERKTNFQSNRVGMSDSTAKVYENGVLASYVQYIENDLELKRFMSSGPCGTVSATYSTAIEVVEGDSVRHVGGGSGIFTTRADAKQYWNARRAFADIYNAQYSLQAVEDPYGSGGGQR